MKHWLSTFGNIRQPVVKIAGRGEVCLDVLPVYASRKLYAVCQQKSDIQALVSLYF